MIIMSISLGTRNLPRGVKMSDEDVNTMSDWEFQEEWTDLDGQVIDPERTFVEYEGTEMTFDEYIEMKIRESEKESIKKMKSGLRDYNFE